MRLPDVCALVISVVLSAIGYGISDALLGCCSVAFIRAGLSGIDMCKHGAKEDKRKIPEAVGVIPATVLLIVLFLFIPVIFYVGYYHRNSHFVEQEFIQYLSALLAICCMTLLGFADDVFDLRWRDKVLLPALASMPILLVYFVNYNLTEISVPRFVATHLFQTPDQTTIDLGVFYYVWMLVVCIFCTNSINILAGINGVEVGQSLVIAVSILIFNFMELPGYCHKEHLFSMFFIIPYIFVCLPLLKHNWFPARVFVGDTFCYFSGMLFAVVGILGHFSKTMMLFFVPQVINFVMSVPQIFRLLPCPRHRLPRIAGTSNSKDEVLLTNSSFTVSIPETSRTQLMVLNCFELMRLVRIDRQDDVMTVSNMTLINLVLIHCGPMTEPCLCLYLLVVQAVFCSMAFIIRYGLASLVF